jgi:hypothetical protein
MSLLDQVNASVAEGTLGGSGMKYPKPVQGRVVHIDADFLAYQVSAESAAELDPEDPTPRKSKEDMQHNAKVAVEHIMRLGAGTAYHLHTTPSGSSKGGRDAQAILKEYQANRKDRDGKPEFLDHIRAYLISEIGAGGRGTAHLDQEADDGMATAAWAAHAGGTAAAKLCVVASKDKDLRMCPGYQLIDDEVSTFDGTFGDIWLDRAKSSPKCTGRGTKFFWAQVLMGDPADHISGLPQIVGKHHLAVKPTKAYTEAIKKLGVGTPAEDARAQKVIDAALAKRKPCGAVMTVDLLQDVKDDREAFKLVKSMWVDLEKDGYVFQHWRTADTVTATQALLSDMLLLWMRRNKNPRDVVDWIKEVMA